MQRWLLPLLGLIVVGCIVAPFGGRPFPRVFPEEVAAAASAAAEARCVDINAAPPEELMRIIHLDAVRAAEAVELRERRPFADVRDLMRLRGIGPSRLIDIEAQGLACVGSEAPAGSRPEIAGQARIIDGDTIDIADERIRLIGIDAPEDGQVCLDGAREWPCGEAAAEALQALTEGAPIRCEVYGRDRSQRALAVCYADDVNLNSTMVRSGAALAWYPDRGAVPGPSYAAEQTEAESVGTGMWRGEFTPPWEWRRQ
jgi:endonuclease YncB( thermonuclease family)